MSSDQEQIRERAYYLWLDGFGNDDEDRYYHAENYHQVKTEKDHYDFCWKKKYEISENRHEYYDCIELRAYYLHMDGFGNNNEDRYQMAKVIDNRLITENEYQYMGDIYDKNGSHKQCHLCQNTKGTIALSYLFDKPICSQCYYQNSIGQLMNKISSGAGDRFDSDKCQLLGHTMFIRCLVCHRGGGSLGCEMELPYLLCNCFICFKCFYNNSKEDIIDIYNKSDPHPIIYSHSGQDICACSEH